MARHLDPRESPWPRSAHSAEVRASLPSDVDERLDRAVAGECRERGGKFSRAAAVREALAQWLETRSGQ